MNLSIVIPVYNEAPGLNETLKRFEATLTQCPGIEQFDVIIVDDGSTDGAFENLALPPRARLIRHPENRGYGAALKTGIRAATNPVITICDADGSYLIESLPQLLALYTETTLVVAARQSIAYAHFGSLKRLARTGFTLWLWSLTGFWIRDINSGLRVFSKAQIEPILDLLSDRFSFTTGTTIQWILAKRPIVYFSTAYAARRGNSKIRFIRDGMGVIRQVLRMMFRRRPIRTGIILAAEIILLIAIAVWIMSL